MKLFEKVKCKGFYKKVWDGKCLHLDKENLKAYTEIDWKGEFCGEVTESIEKSYYEHIEKSFSGVIVGFKDIIVTAELEAIYLDAVDVGVGTIPEKFLVAKYPKDVVKCAIVYYSNNKKHYVPLEEIIE